MTPPKNLSSLIKQVGKNAMKAVAIDIKKDQLISEPFTTPKPKK